MTSFLSSVSHYQVTLLHLAGSANLPSDFASRNAPACDDPRYQVCSFVCEAEDLSVRPISVHDVFSEKTSLPFTSRSAWLQSQLECPDFRRVHSHLKQITRPSKKLKIIKDVKRYLNLVSISREGLLVVKRDEPFAASRECIPGFASLCGDEILRQYGFAVEVGRVKNPNKNPVAEKCVAELGDELLRICPEGGTITPLSLAVATANLNTRIRNRGLSAREM